MQELDAKHNDLQNAAQKIQDTEEELNFLKNEVEKERRNSTVDQGRLRKM